MRQFILLSFTLAISAMSFAQSKSDGDRIEISALKQGFTFTVKNKTLSLPDNRALDSVLKKTLPTLTRPGIVLDTPDDMDPEDKRQIALILEQCHCAVAGFVRNAGRPSPAKTSFDTTSHQ